MNRLRSRTNLKSKSTEPPTPAITYQYALRLLTGRDYSVQKLRAKLTSWNLAEQDVESTLLRLQEEGLMDDRRYAAHFAESALSDGRFYGPRLRQEMRRRGVTAELVDDVLKQVCEEYNEADELRSVIDRRYPGFVYSAASDKEKRRVISWLQRHGFGISAILTALRGV
jgi:regulatory protein